MRIHSPFGLALAAGLVSVLALSPRFALAAEETKPAEEAKPRHKAAKGAGRKPRARK